MAVRKVRIWPDPALKEIAVPVSQVDDGIRQLVRDLFETMYKANGVGLAATQVAVPVRVLVIDLDPHGEAARRPEVKDELTVMGFTGPRAYINPEKMAAEGQVTSEEGCLSVPGVSEPVSRHQRVVVKALDVNGQPFTVEATGLYAVALEHEMDHLEGRVFVDYLSKLKRDVIRRKMEHLKEEDVDDGVEAAALL